VPLQSGQGVPFAPLLIFETNAAVNQLGTMRTADPKRAEQANVLLFVVCTITIVSVIGANVLLNCVTRYNTSSSQVRAWKESLYAAEAGGDIAYAEVRKTVFDRNHAFSGWTYTGGVWTNTPVTFGADNQNTSSRADAFWVDGNGNPWYRIRALGTAPVLGLKRTTMDDRMGPTTRGDSLLRKVDFNYDHFIATYGANGDNQNKSVVAVNTPQITRRVELVAAPMTPFEAAIKAGGTFYGLGSAAYVDSFRSSAGPYDPSVRTTPSDPRYVDALSGTVEINTAIATIMGSIYGNLYTNGGTITKKTSSIFGIIDNNVPFTLPPFVMPDVSNWNYVPTPTAITSSTTITTITPPGAGTAARPNYYLLSSFNPSGSLSVNPYVSSGTAQETYVAVHVTGDIGSASGQGATIVVPAHVHLQIYFDGNFGAKAQNIINTSGYAGNLQFYGISPTDPSVQQTVDLNSGGSASAGFSAVFYAPSANLTINGGPDITGAVVCHDFYSNGNVHWHYDRSLDNTGDATDYRIASYVEDTR
jgi:hypothetical protein